MSILRPAVRTIRQCSTIPRLSVVRPTLNPFFNNSIGQVRLKDVSRRFFASSNSTQRTRTHSYRLLFLGIGITSVAAISIHQKYFNKRFELKKEDQSVMNNSKTLQNNATPKLDGDKIAEALQSEAAFTVASDNKPIVATYGCGQCVAIGGYDPTNKIAFVVHFANPGEVRESGSLIFYNISKLVKEPITAPIQLHLRGGIEGESEATIEAIKIWMKQRSDLPMEIVSEDISESYLESKSLSIDSRTGKVSEYHPLANPKHREMSEMDIMSAMLSGYDPKIRLAYSPNKIRT